jgi:hypothetical protein
MDGFDGDDYYFGEYSDAASDNEPTDDFETMLDFKRNEEMEY